VLPGTHNNEAGYFSLCEGPDGGIYIGTEKTGENSYLVRFDPQTERQRIVIDTHRLCALTAKGYAAQAKIHTRNFVGPSGTIYCGSMQGHRQPGDTSTYPGGYVMTYDPKTDTARCLGMPAPGEGVIDVVADEERGLLYVATIGEESRWVLGEMRTLRWRGLGVRTAPFASTLLDGEGGASILTREFRLARYDPVSDKVTVRDIVVDGERFDGDGGRAVPAWQVAPDGRTAYLTMMSNPVLLEFDLLEKGQAVHAVNHGLMIEGGHPDTRSGLAFGPDGNLYAVVRVDNDTGFGTGMLHHLLRFNPRTGRTEDLGVLAVRNPDFFDFGPDESGRRPPFSHGFHTLPDGTLTPLYHHLALTVARDGTCYVTILYPFTLLRIEGVARPAGG